jgi:hypothetical protein
MSQNNISFQPVFSFQALSETEVFVLGSNGNLWLEFGPFGFEVPPPRVQVDGNVKAFQAFSSTLVFVLGSNGNLWLEFGPFGAEVPPPRVQVDGNVKAFQTIANSDSELLVLGTDSNLWLEHGPFGVVPPTRQLVDRDVVGFVNDDPNFIWVLDANGKLWIDRGPLVAWISPPDREFLTT